jgi:PTH1 family peptidyl-tRNA hydrolase
MKLIVGLGNIGMEYEQTRHNLGFMVADALVATHDLPVPSEESKLKAFVSKGKIGDTDVLIAKPTTYINLSGQAVRELARYYKVDPADVWVIHDELDLTFGKLRVRQGGGTAGHNGLKSIVDTIGDGFGRYRVGIANNTLKNPIAAEAFVLAKFSEDEQAALPQIISKTSGIVLDHLNAELTDTTYNLI